MKKAKILVVEDQNIVALNIRNKLKNLGYTVPGISIHRRRSNKKSRVYLYGYLVLMDIMLKGDMDGIEAAREISSRLGIPVLYLTAYTDDETLERAKMTEPAGVYFQAFQRRGPAQQY